MISDKAYSHAKKFPDKPIKFIPSRLPVFADKYDKPGKSKVAANKIAAIFKSLAQFLSATPTNISLYILP